MSFAMISALKSLTAIGMLLIATCICIPNAIKFWVLWQDTKNQRNLSVAINYALGAFFLLSADFLVFMKAIGGCVV
ncbi:MAG: hypothetical protein RL235_709 [Chlamydiota bacterium]|jgi:hypothetical protein